MTQAAIKKGQKNRLKILQTADQLIYEKGYHQTSFGDIAKAVGMAKGNFYYYFKSKEEILDGIVANRVENIKQMLQQWDQQYPDIKDRLKRFVLILDNERQNIMDYGCPIGSLFVELGKEEKKLQHNIRSLIQVFLDWLIVQFRLLGKENAEFLAKDILAKTQGVALLANVLTDEKFINQSIEELNNWVVSL